MVKRQANNHESSPNSKRQAREAQDEAEDELAEEDQTQHQEMVEDEAAVMDAFAEEDDEDGDEYADEAFMASGPKPMAEAGVIHKIYCENFMNHQKLEVPFCRNINFIHGQNGSGKSAILAALQICLGARASVTHRGENLGSLVRRNTAGGHTATARVQVTLLNGGPDAFEPHKYGGKITIERTFDARGKNGYKLMNGETSKVVSTKKRDLDLLLDRLNVQVENPVCIMDQENSKEFIKGNEKDKYRFFSKATDLSRVVTLVQETCDLIRVQEQVFAVSHARLGSFGADAEQAEADLKELQQALDMDTQIKRHQCMLFWQDVAVKQAALTTLEAAEESLVAKEAERASALAQAQAALSDRRSPEEGLAEIERLKAAGAEAQAKAERLAQDIKEASKPVGAATRAIQALGRETGEVQREVKRLAKQIEAARRDNEEALRGGGAEAQAKADALAQAQAGVAQAQADHAAAKREAEAEATPRAEATGAAHKAAADAAGAAARHADAARRHCDDLAAAASVPTAQFGRRVPQILAEIAKQRLAFQQPPVGPLGLHVSMRDAAVGRKWGGAVGACLGPSLRAFCVDSFEDQKVLTNILHKCGALGEHSVQVLRFAPKYDTARRAPQGDDLFTVEKAIHVDNDLAFNALVEATGMESVPLFDSTEEGQRACFLGRSGQWTLRRGVSKVMDVDGRVASVKNGNMYTHPAPYGKRHVQFGVAVKDQIAQAQEALAVANQAARQAQEKEVRARDAARGAKQRVTELERRMNGLNAAKRKDEQRASKLANELADLQAETAVDTSEWEEEMVRLRADEGSLAERVEAARKAKAEAEHAARGLDSERKQYQKTVAKLDAEMHEVEEQLSGLLREHEKQKKDVAKAERKLQDCRDGIDNVRGEAAAALGAVEAATEAARKYTEAELGPDTAMPMEVKKDRGWITTKITRLRATQAEALARLPPGQRNMEEAMHRAVKARATYEDKVADTKACEANLKFLRHDNKRRVKKWKRFRRNISVQTSRRFDMTLNRKGQCGEVEFDHKKKELRITVQKDNRDSQSQIENVKLLSGGERSYATLSLLVALGECLECPFRVMDEFDVFMDVVSRKIALEQLIEEGLANKHRQFVFITPQDLSSVTPTPEVKIIKLRNPNRQIAGQSTL